MGFLACVRIILCEVKRAGKPVFWGLGCLLTFCPQPRGSNERLPALGKPPFITILMFIFNEISLLYASRVEIMLDPSLLPNPLGQCVCCVTVLQPIPGKIHRFYLIKHDITNTKHPVGLMDVLVWVRVIQAVSDKGEPVTWSCPISHYLCNRPNTIPPKMCFISDQSNDEHEQFCSKLISFLYKQLSDSDLTKT